MKDNPLARLRMYNQYISNPVFGNPEDVVKNMLAMQAQDYAGAKWALGIRMASANESVVEQAITDGRILRTHLLRPTWHFVAPADIRWLLALTAPRIHAINSGMYKKFELNAIVFNKANNVFIKNMQGNKQLTRAELTDALNRDHIPTDDLRFTLLLMNAELDGVICSGGRVGKQFTYALLDERAPATPLLTHDEALRKLAGGFFNTRGPATVHDFANWSGLTIADAGIGLEHIKGELISELIEGKTYWMPDRTATTPTKNKVYLLPAFDEFAIAYKDRDALVAPRYREQARHLIFDPVIVMDYQVVGNWKRAIKTNDVAITYNLFGDFKKTQGKALEAAAKRYKNFLL
ncbi:winged helix DNA-binding domain-containing protein [Mucilaginibacter ginsenosidivorax]|uniref:Winged helix DNA-binding domain-containing protein n=1 Tax=Mucilaginibacter ginsenosidivorax TaxID=862126 RepID=A0A5B8W7V8_9SPHI|nr:winged helix DNA-binding domain-containing protein [Mucilaginibacter ginsenosidivorax]QEC80090.1 winged helix DNA-binding domain-containing protein [Mucilaginibacter ginsenosidivorax]